MSKKRKKSSKQKQECTCNLCFFVLLQLVAVITFALTTTSLSSLSTKEDSLFTLPTLGRPSCQLAYKQSFGFFTDITDEQWKNAQKVHASVFPNHFDKDLKPYSHPVEAIFKVSQRDLIRNSNWWYAENFQEEFHCLNAQRVPSNSHGDGPKWICDPHRLQSKMNCLVYSFGSNGNIQFEKGVKDVIGKHCEIHTFDPMGYNRRHGEFGEALANINVTFHKWGLARDTYKTEDTQFMSLKDTMKALGHTNRTVDIFKIDCETCEWYTYKSWLESGADLRQILVETHNSPMPEGRDFFFTLHDAGYVIFSKEPNLQNRGGGVEYAFLKLSTDFFIHNSMYKYRQY